MWGKIIGGMAGFAMGGPFGAVMGAAFGHAAESKMGGANVWAQFPPFGNATPFTFGFTAQPSFLPSQRDQLFALSVVILSAKVAKVDGPVKRGEIDAFKRAFRIPPESVSDIGQLFDTARESSEDPVAYAKRLGVAFADNPGVLEDVLGALFHIATADGPLNVAERNLLSAICDGFGLGRPAWDRASGASPNRHANAGQEDPYAVLGVSAETGPEELRATWKRLMRENHPDSLASRGMAPEFIARASDKVARINAAWDRIKRDRGL